MTCQLMDGLASFKWVLFSREYFIAGKSGCFFPHDMIYFTSVSVKSKKKGLPIVHPQLLAEFDGLFILCPVTAFRETSSKA